MSCFKRLTIPQMAKRILVNIPELDYSFVVSTIRNKGDLGLEEISVQDWLYYFDSIVIDRKGDVNEKMQV